MKREGSLSNHAAMPAHGAGVTDRAASPARGRAAMPLRLRIMMLGLRGLPDIQGGVEKHVEMLAQQLAAHGHDVEVIGRSPYLPQRSSHIWRGIRVTSLWAPRSVRFETPLHTLLGVFYAAWRRPDILHVHAVGPGLMAPLARLFGLKVVVTHHGYDYDREKWGRLARTMLRLGERLSMRYAQGRIAVSRAIAETMRARYGVPVDHIPNGVSVALPQDDDAVLARFGLSPRRYVVMVARFVPEKRQTDLIAAFARLERADGWKLVLVGGADHKGTAYAAQIETMAAGSPDVVLTGFQSGDTLAALFSRAGLFVLPSLHEGMPISLLEALGYGLPVLASDIPANHEVDLPPQDYFPAGDVDALAAALQRKIDTPEPEEIGQAHMRRIERIYAWPGIAEQTLALYTSVRRRKDERRTP